MNYPKWLSKNGKTIYWSFRGINGLGVVSRGVVQSNRRGRVYVRGDSYGYLLSPADIKRSTKKAWKEQNE